MAAIRSYHAGDADAIAAITLAAIRVTALAAYSPAQVAAWSARFSPARMLEWVEQGHLVLVAADAGDCPLAYTMLEGSGHLDMLYCHPEHGGKGLAGALLAEAEAVALNQGHTRLFTEASELARPVFERAGYQVLHRRDFSIPHEGSEIAIHNYAMEKRIG